MGDNHTVDILAALKTEVTKLQNKLSAVQNAITALNGSGKHATVETSKPRRTMSAAGRRRIILATKRRSAKYRAEKNGSPAKVERARPKRTMSAATRRKISLTMKKLHAANTGK
jgi:hypothetical protein